MKLFVALGLMMLLGAGLSQMKAQEIYAALSGSTMTIYYDDQKASRAGVIADWTVGSGSLEVSGTDKVKVTEAELDASMKDARPTSTKLWFGGFSKMTSIAHLEYLNTSEVTTMRSMFSTCHELTSLDLSGFNTVNVTDMYGMFGDCFALTSLDVRGFDITKATDIQSLFSGCTALTTILCDDDWSASSAKSGNMFKNCTALVGGKGTTYDAAHIDATYARPDKGASEPGYFTSKAETPKEVVIDGINYRLEGETKTATVIGGSGTTIVIPAEVIYKANTYTVTEIGEEAFYFSKSINRISIPNTVTKIGSKAFCGCTYLNHVKVSDQLKEIGDHAFAQISDLTYIALPASLQTIGRGAFNDCSNLSYVEMLAETPPVLGKDDEYGHYSVFISNDYSFHIRVANDDVVSTYKSAAGWAAQKNIYSYGYIETMSGSPCGRERFIDGINYFLYPSSHTAAASPCAYKGGIIIPNSVEFEGETYTITTIERKAFSNCFQLASVIIPGTVTSIKGSAFEHCSDLTSIDIPGSVEEIGGKAFAGCGNINTVSFHDGLQEIGSDAFYQCGRITELSLPNTLVSIGSDAFKLTGLSSVYIPASVTFIGSGSFGRCENLTAITVDAENSTYCSVDGVVFTKDKKTLYMYPFGKVGAYIVPDGVETISEAVFEKCENLTAVTLSASLKTIKKYAFAYSKLTEITLPEGITTLEDYAFTNCSDLTSITSYAVEPPTVGMQTFNNVSKDIPVKVPAGSVDKYKAAEGWKEFTNIQAIDEVPQIEIYAVQDGTKMVLYYDDQKASREGVIAGWTAEKGTDEITSEERAAIISVELDASMKDARPTSLNSWFYSLGNVTEIVHLDYLNTSEVTDMSDLFNSCGVRTLDLSTFNTEKVTTMHAMFNQCSVSNLNISSFNTSNVTDMSYMFSSGWQLTELDITHFNTEKVWNMSYMFHQSNIKVLDLRNFSVAQNPSMTAMFERASTTTIICDQDWSQTTGGDSWMFEDSKSLEGGQGTKWSSENPTGKKYARPDDPENGKPGYFTTTEDLTRRWIYAVQDGTKMVLYYDNQKRTRENVISDWTAEDGANNMTNEEKAAITSIELDASMQAARPTSTFAWFAELENVTSIAHLDYLNTSGVTNMSYMFYYCESLTSLDVSGFNTANVANMAAMFQSCSSLTSLDVSGFNTAKVMEMRNMFSDCSSLTSLDVSNFNTAKVKGMGGMFLNCVELTSLNVSGFNTVNVTNMSGMFFGCSSLTSLDVSGFNTANVTSMQTMFLNCSSLTTIICEDDWSASTVLEDSKNMFQGCTALKGGKGTAYDEAHVDVTYARPDGLDDEPGYFTSEEDTDWPCGEEEYSYNVDVIEPGTFAILMVDAMGAQTWTEVKSLCVSGNLNADDQAWLAKMPNIQYLNLRHTNITEFGECKEYKSLEKVVLPKTCKTLKKNAFYRCEKLTSINLKYVENIGEEAFCYCSLLPSESLDLRNAKWVNHRAFEYCKALTTVSLPKATYVGTQCFVGCEELTSIVVPNLQKVGGSAFAYNTKLTYAYIGDVLEKMEGSEFYGCKALKSLHLPAALRYLGSSSVGGIERLDGDWPKYLNHVGNGNFTNLTSVVIGPYITYWYSLSDKWTDIYCYAIDPATVLSEYEHVFNDNKVANMTLHVPAASVASYKLNANYSKFGHIVPMDDIIYDLNVNSDFQLLKTDNISEHANLDLKEGAGMTTSASAALNLGSYHQIVTCVDKYHRSEGSGDNKKYYAHLYRTGVLCANSPVYSDEVMVSLVPRHKAWSFFSLPFDVNMQDITISTLGKGKYAYGEGVEGVSQWVIREYSCENRASGEGATWNNVPADGVLKAHTGYILYWLVEGGTSNSNDYPSGGLTDEFLYVFNMPAMHTDNLQDIFETGDAIVPLTHYSSEFPQNRNWNFIGNPYPCAFNIRETNLDAPITVWKGKGYTAYSPIDDPFILRPAEAFFVQAPDAMDAITFYKEGRYPSTKIEIDENSYQLQLAPSRERSGERTLYNFLLSSDTYTDRARLVLNEEASMAYELNRDASKMMSSDNSVPQIWMENDGIRYAINEQPESEAYTMGALFGQAGEYTLNVQSGDAQHTILLTDKVENKTVDLSEGGYTFSTKAGEFNGRFLVQFGHKMPTGIQNGENGENGGMMKVLVNGQLILITPEGKAYTAEGRQL